MNQENIVTPTIPRLKTFKWTALNESVDEKDNNNNNNNNTNNIIGNKPLWNKHLSSQSLDIFNDSLKQKIYLAFNVQL
ncbi:unnamed protein product [Heterobilharzia americana]|nr:unnamed protein product [Heterobilharzia americana]